MVNISAKFYEAEHTGLVSIAFTNLFPYMSIVTLTFDPLISKINRVHPLVIVNICAKFDEDAHNSLVAIVFTRIRREAQTNGLTERTHGRNHGSVTISPRCAGIIISWQRDSKSWPRDCKSWPRDSKSWPRDCKSWPRDS